MCGTVFVPGENKFCEGCGMELPTDVATMTAPAQKSTPTFDTDDVVSPSTTGPSNTVGRNSIQSSSNNTSNSNNITTTNTTVNNTTTTIEDDTKKSIVCAVSGKRVLYIDSACCKGCNKDVSLEYYNEKTRKCENCHQGYLQQYRDAFEHAMASSGIDRNERADLDILANSLQLTDAEKMQIEQQIKSKYENKTNSDFSELDELFEMDFKEAKKDILIKNDLSSALLKLKQIYDQVQTNDEVSCLYFLLKALKSPSVYLANYESKSFEDYWENYWYFLAQLTNGDKQRKGFSSFRQNLSKYEDKADEIKLSEALYFIVAYQFANNESYIEKANDKLVDLDNISSSFLLKLYKSTKHIVLNYDPVDQKFTNLTPPDEPGMREYFLFFLKNLYKIQQEAPKVPEFKAAAPVVPVVPEVPVPKQQEIPKPVIQAPKMPEAPSKPISSQRGPSIPVPTPVSNSGIKQVNSNQVTAPKIPPMPTATGNKPPMPGAVSKPAVPPLPENQKKTPPVPPKVPGRPPMPPMPGKK